jgi:hypothetical protein
MEKMEYEVQKSKSSSSRSSSPRLKRKKQEEYESKQKEYESYKYLKPMEIPQEAQKINANYQNLINYLKRKQVELTYIGDFTEIIPEGISSLILYLKNINQNNKLPLEDKQFVTNKFDTLKTFDQDKYTDFITILNKVEFPEYYNEYLLSKLIDDIVVMNKKRDLLELYNNINTQIYRKFNMDPEMSKETTKDFVNRYLMDEGYLPKEDIEYSESRFSKIVMNYKEGMDKEYRELVKMFSDNIAKILKFKQPTIGSIVPKSLSKATKKFRKNVSKKFTEMITGKEIEDVYEPKKFYGPPSTKRLYKEMKSGNIPSVLGKETIKVKGVTDFGTPVDLNIHIFDKYEEYRNTVDCLDKAKYYCSSFGEDTKEEKVIPCILDKWVDKYVAHNFKNGYIVTRDFSDYIKLYDFNDFNDPDIKNKITKQIKKLLKVLFQNQVLHGGIINLNKNNILEKILIQPSTGNIVLTHFENCRINALNDDLNLEVAQFKTAKLVPQDFDVREEEIGNEGKEELLIPEVIRGEVEDISQLQKRVKKNKYLLTD